MLTLIRHLDANTVYLTGRPRDWMEEIAVDHDDPATWPAAQTATGLTLAELSALLDDNAWQIAQLRRLLAEPTGLAAWLDRSPAETPVGRVHSGWPTPVATTTANYLQATGIGPRVATRQGAGCSLALIVERPLPRRLEARCTYPAPFWVRALEWQIAKLLAQTRQIEATAGQACDCLERALAWEQIVRTGQDRPGGYRRTAERLDAWYK